MSVTLVLPAWIDAEIVAAAAARLEAAGVLVASLVSDEHGPARLLAREMHWVDPSAYVERNFDGLLTGDAVSIGAAFQVVGMHAKAPS